MQTGKVHGTVQSLNFKWCCSNSFAFLVHFEKCFWNSFESLQIDKDSKIVKKDYPIVFKMGRHEIQIDDPSASRTTVWRRNKEVIIQSLIMQASMILQIPKIIIAQLEQMD